MGKATIIRHDGNGQYTVTRNYDNAKIDANIVQCNRIIAETQAYTIPEIELAVAAAQANFDTAVFNVNLAIDTWNEIKTDANYADIVKYTKDANTYGAELKKYNDQLKDNQAKIVSIQKRLSELQDNRPTDSELQVWCADLSDGTAGPELSTGTAVGTIEYSGVEDNGLNIFPAFTTVPTFDAGIDGNMTHGIGMTPEAFYYATAIRPGWQKFTSYYRSGTITTKYDDGTFDVELDAVNSAASDQTIDVSDIGTGASNRTLEGIRALYMSCDEDAFSAGDSVVVLIEYTDFGLSSEERTETIIGFTDNPQPCPSGKFVYFPDPHPSGYWQTVDTESGPWTMTEPYASGLTGSSSAEFKTWRQYQGPIISGVTQFVHWPQDSGQEIFIQGVKTSVSPTGATYYIAAAALTPNASHIVAIFYKSGEGRNVYLGRKTSTAELTGALYDAGTAPDGWELRAADSLGSDAIDGNFSDWHINESCTAAVCHYAYTHGALRSPQATPAGGASWKSPAATYYNSTWAERLEYAITTPEAAALAGMGVTFTETGDTDGRITEHTVISLTCSSGSGDINSASESQSVVYSGSYAIDSGYNGDTEVKLNITGSGTAQETGNYTGEKGIYDPCLGPGALSANRNISADDIGLYWVCAEYGLRLPKLIWNPQESTALTYQSNFTSIMDTDIIGELSYDMDKRIFLHNQFKTINTLTINAPTPPEECNTSTYQHVGETYETRVIANGKVINTQSYVKRDEVTTDVSGSCSSFAVAVVPDSTASVDIYYDYTAHKNYVASAAGWLSSGLISNPYAHHFDEWQGARSDISASCAWWRYLSPSGEVLGDYLTGGDLEMLDGLTDPIVYRAIHAMGTE